MKKCDICPEHPGRLDIRTAIKITNYKLPSISLYVRTISIHFPSHISCLTDLDGWPGEMSVRLNVFADEGFWEARWPMLLRYQDLWSKDIYPPPAVVGRRQA
jgi:hypothetical protein